MNLFQVVGIGIAILFMGVTVVNVLRRNIDTFAGLIWFAVWSAAAVALIWPDGTSVVARAMGIDRGADLVFYCAILAVLGSSFRIFGRLRAIERSLTAIVRQIALDGASESPGSDRTGHATTDIKL